MSDGPRNDPGRHVRPRTLLLEDLLTPRQRARVDAHLERCPACRQRAEEIRAVRRLLARTGPVTAPRAFTLGGGQCGQRKRLWYPLLRTVTLGIAAFVWIVFVASLLLQDATSPSLPGSSRSVARVSSTAIIGTIASGTPRCTTTASVSFENPGPQSGRALVGLVVRTLEIAGLGLLAASMALTLWAYRKERPFLA